MPKIVVMRDQTGATGRKSFDAPNGITPHQVLEKTFEQIDPSSITVYIDGEKIELPTFVDGECIDRGDEFAMTAPLEKDSIMLIICEAKDPFTIIIAVIAIVVAAYVYFAMPTVANLEPTSSNNKFYGQTNTARPYSAIPDPYGRVISYPDLATSEPEAYYVAGKKTIIQTHVVGIGQYEMSKMKFGATLLSQIISSTVEIFEPDANGVTTVPVFKSPFSIDGVNGQELRNLTTEAPSSDEPFQIAYEYEDATDRLILTRASGFERQYDTFFNFQVSKKITVSLTGTVGISDVSGIYRTSTFTPFINNVGSFFDIFSGLGRAVIDNASTFSSYWGTLTADQSGLINVTLIQKYDLEDIGPYDTNASGDQIQVDFKWPQGFNHYGNGKLSYSIEIYKIDKPGGTQIDMFNYGGNIDFYGAKNNNFTPRSETVLFDVPTGYYRVTVKRLTLESTDPKNVSLTLVEKIASIRIEQNKTFNNVTMIRLLVREEQTTSSPRENIFNLEAIRKTITYDANTGDVDYTLRPSVNFADAILHEHHIVFGRPLDQIDLDGLYAISNRLINRAPELLEASITFDEADMPLGDRIKILADAARVTPFIEFGVFRFFRDERRQFTNGLICSRDISKNRNYSRTFKSFFPSSRNGVVVEYVDNESNKKAYVYRTFDENGNIIDGKSKDQVRIKLAACRNAEQAINRANYECARLLSEGYLVSDTVMRQGNAFDIGDVIKYADVFLEDIVGGEVLAIDHVTGDVTLSEEIPGGSPDYQISYTNRYGEVQGPFDFVLNTPTTITMDPVQANDIYSAYVQQRQMGSRFIVSKVSDAEAEMFKIIEKQPRDDGDVQLKMIQYRDSAFDFEAYLSSPLFFAAIPNGLTLNNLDSITAIKVTTFNNNVLVGCLNGKMFKSTDGATTFTALPQYIGVVDGTRDIWHIASHNGQLIVASLDGARASRSTDGGTTWTELPRYLNTGATVGDEPSPPFAQMSIGCLVSNDNDGLIVFAGIGGGAPQSYASISTDGGATFSPVNVYGGAGGVFTAAAISASGSKIIAMLTFTAHISTDTGATWVDRSLTDLQLNDQGPLGFSDVDMSADGQVIAIGTTNGRLVISTDGGTTFRREINGLNSGAPEGTGIEAVRVSGDGVRMFVTFRNGFAAYSSDSGVTWGPAPQYLKSGALITNFAPMDMRIDGDLIIAGYESGFASRGDWALNQP